VTPARWIAALAASLALHGLAVLVAWVTLAPEPPGRPEPVTARLGLGSEPVPVSEAAARTPEGETAGEAEASGEAVGTAAIPRSRAGALDAGALADRADATAARGDALASAEPDAAPLEGRRAAGTALEGRRAVGATLEGQRAAGAALDAAEPETAALSAARAEAAEAPSRPVAGATVAEARLAAEAPLAPEPSGERLPTVAAAAETARPAAPEGSRLATLAAGGATAAAADAPSLALARVAETGTAAAEIADAGTPAAEADAPAPRLASAEPAAPRAAPASPDAPQAPVSAAGGTALGAAEPPAGRVPRAAPDAEDLAASAAPAAALGETMAEAAPAPAAQVGGLALRTGATAASRLADRAGATPSDAVASTARGRPARSLSDPVDGVPAVRLSRRAADTDPARIATAATAGLAWQGGADTSFDALSLATVQSFMAPTRARESDLHGGDVKDGIQALLADVPCSRLQAAFVPETGALEIRGHVPAADLRGAVEERLARMIGDAIEVGNDLLLLPRPQCEVLSGVAALGIPQSTDQIADPLTVGQAAQAEVLAFPPEAPFSLTMETADYDAYILLDYYDAGGNVLHVMPNELVGLRRYPAETKVTIGSGAPGFEGFALTVQPPYGRDIAVAIATSVPIHRGERPLVEPAGPYLDWLRARLAEISSEPDFRGEWVYLFIDTGVPQ